LTLPPIAWYCVLHGSLIHLAEGGLDHTEQWLVQLRKGLVELLVLRLLVLKGELHGYAIVRELLSLGRLVAGESTVYPVLRRLQEDGLLESRWVEAEGGPPRKYYSVTDLGLAFLVEAGREWEAIVESMQRLQGVDDYD
jgi:PadR family transcriptional regulator PadR